MRNKPYDYYSDYSQIESVPDMLYKRAKEFGNKSAFRYMRHKNEYANISFNQVLSDVEQLIEVFDKEYGRDRKIAIIGENSYSWILCFLATISSHNIAVLIDKDLPPCEIQELLNDSETTDVLYSNTYADLLETIDGVRFIGIDEIVEKRITCNKRDLHLQEYNLDSLVCMFFTSGTSGKSKVVMVTHKNLVFSINSVTSMMFLGGNALHVLPLNHAFGLITSVLTAYNVASTNYINVSLRRLKNDLNNAKPKALILVPLFIETFYKQIMDTAKKENKLKKLQNAMRVSDFMLRWLHIDLRKQMFKDIRSVFGGDLEWIICGGAALNKKYIKAFRSWGIEILQGYGATECTPVISTNRNHYHRDGSVGNPLPGTEVKIATDGEILVKGPHVMKGYYNNPEQTAEALKDGWYHTGDLGYIDKDNFVFITGRKKNLIILSNGENVSPEELEQDIHKDNEVREVLVYELEGVITAEIYPTDDYIGNYEYFQKLVDGVNRNRPMYKQVVNIILRDTEFIKNSSKKIVRSKNI